MPSPSSSLATLRPDIADSFTEFDLEMNIRGFVWDRVLPVFEVSRQSGTFGRIPIEQLLQNRETRRAPGAGYARGNWTFTTETFATVEHGAEEPVDDNEAAMYRDYFDAEVVSALRARSAVLLNAEKRVADAIFNTSTWTGSALATGVSTTWSTAASATPIADVEGAVQKVYDGTGIWPDTIIMSKKVFRLLRNVDEIIERIASSGAGSPTKATDINESMLAQVFDLPKVVVAGSSKNTAAEGQDASISQVWSDTQVMVCKTASSQDFREPCLGRTFHWGDDGSSVGGTVESYREEQTRSDVIRVRHQVDEKVIYKELGHLLTGITT